MNSTSEISQQKALGVFLVDDSQPLRERIAGMLNAIRGVTIVGEAETPAEAISGILDWNPDAVVLDLQLRGGSGLEVLKAVHPQKPAIVFIVLTNHSTPAYERQCLLHGASHFIDKSLDFASVKQHVCALRDGRPRH